jgi:hypothetical protein
VVFSADSVEFCLDSACSQPATGADGSAPFELVAHGGVSLANTANFYFNALGSASLSSAQAMTVSGDTILTVTIEADTGYVH